MPAPAVTYAVNTIRPSRGQTIEGSGRYDATTSAFQFTGNGVDPVFELIKGSNSNRQHTLRDLTVVNDGGQCIYIDEAPDFLLENIRASSVGANCVYVNLSVRGAVRNCKLGSSGAGTTAFTGVNYLNGLVMSGVTISGGSAGRALVLESTQGYTLDGIRIEGSLDGIWIASTSEAGFGNCSGGSLSNIYVEQCKTPLVLGKRSQILGLHGGGIFISNSQTDPVSAREACIQFGRMNSVTLEGISLLPHGTEDLFWLWLENASGGFGNVRIQSPNVTGTPNSTHAFKGAFAANASVKAAVGGVCDFGFMGGSNRLGSSETREWISPLIDSAVSSGPMIWLPEAVINMGGKVRSVEIIDCDAGNLTGVSLTIGRTGLPADTVNIADMGTLTPNQGYAPLNLGSGANIYDGQNNIYQITTAPGATAKFRIRIRYSAN